MKIKKLILASFFLVLICLLFENKSAHSQNIVYSGSLSELERVRLEQELEERLRDRLNFLFQDEKLFTVVRIRLSGEEVPVTVEQGEDREFALPGVPMERNITSREKTAPSPGGIYKVRRNIENIYASIYVTKNVSEDILEKARELSTDILGIETERGDTISIQTYSIGGETIFSGFKELSLSDKLKWSMFGLVSILGAVFLFGPFRTSLKNLNDNLSSLRIGGNPTIGAGTVTREIQNSPARESSSNPGESEDIIDFSFINEDNLEDVIYILSKSTNEEAIVVINNLPDDLASRIIDSLPTTKQREIISQLKETKFMNPKAVESVRDIIKNKVNSIYGGINRVTRLIQGCSKPIKENTIEWLKEEDPGFARKIEDNIIEFTDLLNYSDEDFRRIFREAGMQSFSTALKSLDDEMVSAFSEKLSPDVADLLKEQLNIIPENENLSQRERKRIVDITQNLIKGGYISKVEKEEI